MNFKHVFVIFSLTCFSAILAFPALETFGDDIIKCYFLECPRGTAICERNTTTLDEPKVIRTTAACKDFSGTVLKSDHEDVRNDKTGYKTNIYTFRLKYSKSNVQNN
ncbi:hypothetical protein QE152_g8514 [Popillia japonica]|uniref:Uncharacterized protein n=1 Tax=Popillia japonica TaxID=7064 RepID=A0AAW1M7L1_POPJA